MVKGGLSLSTSGLKKPHRSHLDYTEQQGLMTEFMFGTRVTGDEGCGASLFSMKSRAIAVGF